MAMVTTSKDRWPADVPIRNLKLAGLPKECKVRLKLFTLDNQLVLKATGRLSEPDQDQIRLAWIQAGLL
jgi:mRNA interferase MazF